MHILYLEDSEADANLIRQYLRTTNHTFEVARSMDEARNHLQQNAPDVFLVDIVIQGEMAYDLITLAAKQGQARHIVAVTAKAMPGEQQHYLNLGCNYVLPKPFTVDDLEQVLNALA